MERSQFTNDQIIWSADVPREEIQAVIDAKNPTRGNRYQTRPRVLCNGR